MINGRTWNCTSLKEGTNRNEAHALSATVVNLRKFSHGINTASSECSVYLFQNIYKLHNKKQQSDPRNNL